MKKLIASFCIMGMFSCHSSDSGLKKAEDAQEAGTQFIRASLDGEYDKARFFLFKDSTNLMLLDKLQTDYQHLSDKEKSRYKESTIRPINITNENDSTTLYKYYHTSNPSDTTILRIIKNNGNWVVDLKSVIKL